MIGAMMCTMNTDWLEDGEEFKLEEVHVEMSKMDALFIEEV